MGAAGVRDAGAAATLRFEPFGYQLQAAGSALRAMRGRAILADEVGLGKTIEAGLVASELRLRGLAARTLILVPVGLVEQWQQELDRKFGLPTVLAQCCATRWMRTTATLSMGTNQARW
jgi:SNF2 family DNA or RNA helicase